MAQADSTTNTRPTDVVTRNRATQADLYGEPLDVLLGRLMTALGLTQARLAKVLGLSAPMLSQLIGGHRIKIGNPAAVQRLQGLSELAQELAADAVTREEVEEQLTAISAQTGAFTHTVGTGKVPAPAGVRAIQRMLRAVASAEEVLAAADQLSGTQPAIAEFLRVYGVGRTAEAVEHYNSHSDVV